MAPKAAPTPVPKAAPPEPRQAEFCVHLMTELLNAANDEGDIALVTCDHANVPICVNAHLVVLRQTSSFFRGDFRGFCEPDFKLGEGHKRYVVRFRNPRQRIQGSRYY